MQNPEIETYFQNLILPNCLRDQHAHGCLLRLFVVLEAAGARRIHRFLRHGVWTEQILSHAAEEARHALFFARKYRQVTGSTLDIQSVSLLDRSGLRYFRSIDLLIGRFLESRGIALRKKRSYYAYLLTTMIVEVRAVEIYLSYDKVIASTDSRLSLKPLLQEECRHLKNIEENLQDLGVNAADRAGFVQTLRSEEESLWLHLQQRILQSMSHYKGSCGKIS